MSLSPTKSPFWLYIGGSWQHLEGITPGVSNGMSRPSSSFVSLGGKVRTQQARRAARTWDFGYVFDEAEAVRWLALAASGLAGDVFLYDALAFQANGLDPLNTVGTDPAQPLVNVDGVNLRAFAELDGFTTMTRPGVEYHLSGWTTQAAGDEVAVAAFAGESATSVFAPPGAGPREWSASFLSLTATRFTVQWGAAGVVSGAMLTESSLSDSGFIPGEKGVCQVTVGDPQPTRRLAPGASLPLSDYTVTVQEVG